MELRVVSAQHIDRAWSDGADQLEVALKRCGDECTASQLKMMLSRGEKTLLCLMGDVPSAWAAVEVQQLPNLRALHVYAIHAPGNCVESTLSQLEDYARHMGCSAIQGACDAAVSRLWSGKFDFREQYRIMRKSL